MQLPDYPSSSSAPLLVISSPDLSSIRRLAPSYLEELGHRFSHFQYPIDIDSPKSFTEYATDDARTWANEALEICRRSDPMSVLAFRTLTSTFPWRTISQTRTTLVFIARISTSFSVYCFRSYGEPSKATQLKQVLLLLETVTQTESTWRCW